MLKETLPVKEDNNRRVLVTGASGLVGGEVVRQLLDKGYNVRAQYFTKEIDQSHPKLETVQCDLLDVIALEEIFEGITHVYHCAAIVSFDPKSKYALLKMNVEGTANVVNACIDASVEKLVHVSSVAALGRMRANQVVTEKMNWTEETSNSTYGKSKYLGELEVWRGAGEGLNVVIVNPSIIFGGNNWDSGSPAIFKTAYNEFAWYTEGISGFVDVRDVARAMILLMNSDITSQRFILNGENVPYKVLFTEIAKTFGKRPPHRRVNTFMAEVVWRIEAVKSFFTGKKHLLTKETARTAQAKVYFDNTKILEALPGFSFTEMKDTIAFTCAAFKEKYHL